MASSYNTAMFKFLRQKKPERQLHYEEKKYSFGVLVLVFMMTIVLFTLGQRAFADLSDGIPRIKYPYAEIQALPEQKEFDNFQRNTLSKLQNRKRELESKIRVTRQEYDTSLLENIAQENKRLYGSEDLLRGEFAGSSEELVEVNTLLAAAEKKSKSLWEAVKEARKPIIEKHRWEVRIRQAKVFAWEALFWIPFLALSLLWHTRSKRKESKWEIVSLSSLVAASILGVQSFGIFLWSWIPRMFLEWLWEILRATILTRVVGYYLIMALVIFIFGGLIVFIHRRITDPVRGGKKKIRQGLCPTCSYPLNLSDVYCGGCGKQLKKKCSSCKKEGYTWQTACVHCGKN